MWYVNADGKEGWLPSSILRAMTEEEMMLTSGESTPVDIKLSSTGASADASDMSDSDGELHDYCLQFQLCLNLKAVRILREDFKVHYCFFSSDHNSYNRKSASPRVSPRPLKRSKVIHRSSAHEPHLEQRQSVPIDPRKKSRSETSSDGEVQGNVNSRK